MIDFLNSCWCWVVDNREAIVAFITSSNFIALMVGILTVIRQSKSYKANTNSLNLVNKNTENVTEMKDNVQFIKDTSCSSSEHLLSVENDVANMKNDFSDFKELCLSKINAMIDVQTLVYSTIKDDTIRQSVNSILVEAKYAEANAKAALERELEELKEKFKQLSKNMTEEVSDTVDKVKNVMTAVSEVKDAVNVTRY